MTQPNESASTLTDAELRQLLQTAFPAGPKSANGLGKFDRRPSMCRSSFALEEVDVDPGDGTCLRLLYKDLSAGALSESAVRAKPAFLYDPLREIEAYRFLLDGKELGTATCYGIVADSAIGRYGLLLERADGKPLFQIGDFAVWEHAARWLAGFHQTMRTSGLASAARLRLDRDYYRQWPRRAVEFGNAGDRPRLQRLMERYQSVIEGLLALPVTVIHGEFYASNVLVRVDGNDVRICPVDWEMTAAGPGLLDLAALAAGKWTEEEKSRLAHAYNNALPSDRRAEPDRLMRDLTLCRLHWAVQWLGWSPDWSPPPEQAHDWLAEAFSLADRLGL